jgi:hypothetical protein
MSILLLAFLLHLLENHFPPSFHFKPMFTFSCEVKKWLHLVLIQSFSSLWLLIINLRPLSFIVIIVSYIVTVFLYFLFVWPAFCCFTLFDHFIILNSYLLLLWDLLFSILLWLCLVFLFCR